MAARPTVQDPDKKRDDANPLIRGSCAYIAEYIQREYAGRVNMASGGPTANTISVWRKQPPLGCPEKFPPTVSGWSNETAVRAWIEKYLLIDSPNKIGNAVAEKKSRDRLYDAQAAIKEFELEELEKSRDSAYMLVKDHEQAMQDFGIVADRELWVGNEVDWTAWVAQQMQAVERGQLKPQDVSAAAVEYGKSKTDATQKKFERMAMGCTKIQDTDGEIMK